MSDKLKPIPDLPDYLRKLRRIDFVRKPAATHEQSSQSGVIYGVESLDELFDKASRRGLAAPTPAPSSKVR
jgi:hypothetical protein